VTIQGPDQNFANFLLRPGFVTGVKRHTFSLPDIDFLSVLVVVPTLSCYGKCNFISSVRLCIVNLVPKLVGVPVVVKIALRRHGRFSESDIDWLGRVAS
jgi:hypothetical protein